MTKVGLFRKKPVVVEAVQYPGLRELEEALAVVRWIEANGVKTKQRGGLIICTLEGEMRADPDDWIIKGIQGEMYPCKPDIFEQTYEPCGEIVEVDGEER